MMEIPFFDLHRQYASIRSDVLSAITRVCDSQRFILGTEVQQFESEIAAAIGVKHAIGVSSGTDALIVAMMALDIGPGDEVIVPAFSFIATAASVIRVGATPRFVDVDAQTLTIDVDKTHAALTPRTKAVMPVHLFGLCADVDALARTVGPRIHIIEDAAQAIGASHDARPAGALGIAGCFSFFPTKNLGGFGDGGLVTTTDDSLAARIRLLRAHGACAKYIHSEIGGNFRLDALQAAVLRTKLPHLSHWNDRRRENADRYRQLFTSAGLGDGIRLPLEPEGYKHVFHQFVVRLPQRDAVRTHLASRGIGTEVYYPVPFHRQECFSTSGEHAEGFPNADAAAREVLALPIFPELTYDEQRYVVDAIAECVTATGRAD
jgi:dTDP-4-amino-4,6-dideoxygalactose transaminase